ncbi:MAG: type I restriction-modification system subunit M [Candidatus Marinimicrobia bacterium]|nr:type I restriction-modification system subunit M [Candidatus Neomarinimicrobiota bacterium]
MTDSTRITQDEINNIAWKACDTFRGVVDSSEYKNYILVMLFVKYLGDLWKERLRQLHEQYGGDEKRIQRKLKLERFVLPEHASFDYLFRNRNADDIGNKINIAIQAIEDANPEKLAGVFRNIDYNSEDKLGDTKDRNVRLKHLLEDFGDSRMDLRPSHLEGDDVIGNTYMYLIEKFAAGAGKKGGEFYTPPEVATLLARLADPQPGDRIYDPTCGSGGLLIKAAQEVGSNDFALYGQESNGDTWALCKMNMFLHNQDGADVVRGDTLRNPKHLVDDHLRKFPVVVANPPFSLDKWGADYAASDEEKAKYNRFWRGIPPKSKGDYAFITHMIESAEEGNGRVVVIAPHGVLFRGGAEGKIRQKLIEDNLLDAVIGLPPAIFYGTGIPVTIMVFKKGREQTDVLFIDASREMEPGKRQNKLRTVDIDHMVSTYRDRSAQDKYSYLATPEEIAGNDYNLNIPRYVDTYEEEAEIDIAAVQQEIDDLEAQLSDVRKEMAGYLKELGL